MKHGSPPAAAPAPAGRPPVAAPAPAPAPAEPASRNNNRPPSVASAHDYWAQQVALLPPKVVPPEGRPPPPPAAGPAFRNNNRPPSVATADEYWDQPPPSVASAHEYWAQQVARLPPKIVPPEGRPPPPPAAGPEDEHWDRPPVQPSKGRPPPPAASAGRHNPQSQAKADSLVMESEPETLEVWHDLLDLSEDETPVRLLCPISLDLMTDPVIATDGFTYERSSIEAWFKRYTTSPVTNRQLPSKTLLPNHAVAGLIADYKANRQRIQQRKQQALQLLNQQPKKSSPGSRAAAGAQVQAQKRSSPLSSPTTQVPEGEKKSSIASPRPAVSPVSDAPINVKPMKEWTNAEVVAWVKSLGGKFESVARDFESFGVRGNQLVGLDNQKLQEGFGMENVILRERLLLEKDELLQKEKERSSHRQQPQAPQARELQNISTDDLKMGNQLAKGNFGVVSVATWHGAQVVVKQLKYENSETLREFLNEAAQLASLPSHPHVVQLFGFCYNLKALVLEFMDDGSLEAKVLDHRPSVDPKHHLWLVQVARNVASGLVHVHSYNIIHRDVATRNIFLNKSGQAKIGDFGLARDVSSQPNQAYQMLDKKAIRPLKWEAPESLSQSIYNTKSDVYMFGITLWEMFAHRYPYSDPQQAQIPFHTLVPSIISGELRPTRLEESICPVAIWNLMSKCWRNAAEDRPSIKEVLQELDEICVALSRQQEDGHINPLIDKFHSLDNEPAKV